MSGQKLDLSVVVPELRSRDLLPPDTAGVFASGSMVRGWGNETSDVDVHVITGSLRESSVAETGHVSLEPNVLTYERIFVEGRRWDIEYWTKSQVDQLLAKVTWEAYDSPDSPWSKLSRTELGMLERLPYAVAADDGAWLAAVHQRVRDSAHRVILVGISLRESDGLVEDAAGQLAAGDVHSAVIAARLAFNHVVDALQAHEGQFGSLWPKWRARRMTLIHSKALSFETYWKTETMTTFDPAHPGAWVEETIELCREISAELEV
jgi:predicted nucleotidyltransferase